MKFQTPPNPNPRSGKAPLAYTDHHSFGWARTEPRRISALILGSYAFGSYSGAEVTASRPSLGLYCEPGSKEVDAVLKAKVAYLNARALADPTDVQVGDLVVLNRSESYGDSEVYAVTAIDASRVDLVVVSTGRRGWSPIGYLRHIGGDRQTAEKVLEGLGVTATSAELDKAFPGGVL